MIRLSFMIAGVQKAGTTSLDAYLRQHPQIRMARQKEVHFFDKRPPTGISALDYRFYHSRFDLRGARSDIRLGEATPIYTWWPGALERIRVYNPAIKLIVLLRHPIGRAWSQYRMDLRLGRHALTFAEMIAREEARGQDDPPDRVCSCVSRSLYAPQIRTLLSLFPAEQLLFLRSQDLEEQAPYVLHRVCQFLDIDSISFAPEERHNSDSERLEAPAEAVAYLSQRFADDVLETRELLGWASDEWPF